MQLRVGLDLARVEGIAESITTHGERYLRRTYTEQELRDCAGRPDRLAARFAAKEAAMKALDRGDQAIPWTAIGVCAVASGRPSLTLTGPAAELARARGVSWLDLSITHEGDYAAAVVIAVIGS